MKKISPYILVIIAVVLIFLADFLLTPKLDVSLLTALLFWAGVGHGIIAMAAAADLSKGKWVEVIRPYMQQYYPLLLIFPAAFLIFSRHMDVYPWTQHPTAWLDSTFFIVRNVVALLLPFIAAHFYVRASRKESEKTGFFAIMYIVSFVVAQSFLAYDVVMTFEYPWINTLMGMYFFVEALFAAIAFMAILSGLLIKKHGERFKPAFKDFANMIMGFALLWAGLFYSQYLVIWYGNIPEEVSYVLRRMEMPLLRNMGIYMLLALFVIPFLALVPRKIKTLFPAVATIALIVLSGLLVERLIYLIPAAHLNVFALVLQMVFLGLPFIFLMLNQLKNAGGGEE